MMNEYKNYLQVVESEVHLAMSAIDENEIEMFCSDVMSADKIFLIGVGRVFLSCEAFAKRLSHLGFQVSCVGDITEPACGKGDILIVASGSGESIIPVAIAKKARELGVKKIIHIGSNPKGKMSVYADYMVRIPTQTKLDLPGEIKSQQIMTSLFEQCVLLFGDIISQILARKQSIDIHSMWKYHANLE